MALTEEQQAQLAALEAERDAPEPRTTTGVKGVLHTLIDVASGKVAHLSDDAWTALHRQAEGTEDPAQGQAPPAAPAFGTEASPEG